MGLLLGGLAHGVGWPVAAGGSQSIADALVARLTSLGGELRTGHRVASMADVPSARAVLFDVTPRQLLQIAGDRLPVSYRRRLVSWRYGAGVFKVDWALDGSVPWLDPLLAGAGTVHLGASFDEMVVSEREIGKGRVPRRPYVLLAQASAADPSRAPEGKHTLWAYCHVPHGSDVDMTDAIERQIERFAPTFRERVLARHVMGPAALEAHNANNVGGDIAGGVSDWRQMAARPRLSLTPWATPDPEIFLCSSSTPPGGGVHGMCGRERCAGRAAASWLKREHRGVQSTLATYKASTATAALAETITGLSSTKDSGSDSNASPAAAATWQSASTASALLTAPAARALASCEASALPRLDARGVSGQRNDYDVVQELSPDSTGAYDQRRDDAVACRRHQHLRCRRAPSLRRARRRLA